MRVLAFAVLVAAACGPGSRPGAGAGSAPRPPAMASPGQDAVVDDAWGVGLLIEPAVTMTQVDEQRFVVDTTGRGALEAGVFRFSIVVDPTRAGAGSAALATAGREEASKEGGDELSDVTEVSFLGRPGHAFTFRLGDAHGLEVSMVHDKCVFELVILRSGRPEWMTDYASSVLRNIKPLTGGPVTSPRCR